MEMNVYKFKFLRILECVFKEKRKVVEGCDAFRIMLRENFAAITTTTE